ncbi:DUF7594 domain-containing protein [Microbacterium jejuense]|uniref:CBM96 family carbohydrate-binding protein n=1 Tax=Microbacterium jejuense TaxID=1263637 RepID=UPI0031E8E09C
MDRHSRTSARRMTAVFASLAIVVSTLIAGPATAAVGRSTAVPAAASPAPVEPPGNIVELLKPQHPRLLADANAFDVARDRVETDPRVAEWFADLAGDADAVLPTSPKTRPASANILTTVREMKRRILTLAFVGEMTGDARYTDRAVAELMAAAGFSDWNPGHFLDVGEMTMTVAIGYDWLFDALTEPQRDAVSTAIVNKSLQVALPYYDTTGSNFFVGQSHNWNLVSNAVALGALAIGDEEPAIADEVLRKSVRSIQYGIAEYGPDGAYAESPSYWQYGTDYLVTYLAALTTATGTDFGLSDLPGLSQTGAFGIHVTGPAAQTFNYGDGGTELFGGVVGGWHSPFMMWLGDRYDQPELTAWQADRADLGASPLDILWYDADAAAAAPHPPETDAVFAGTEVATARSAWDDPYATYVATKGLRAGYDQVAAHMNLDAGDFILEANGMRWLEEQGADAYQGAYFDWKLDQGGRWDYFTTRAEGQNTMVLGTGPVASEALAAGARITDTGSTDREWYSVTDLTPLYAGRVERAERGIRLFDDRRQVLVQDEVSSAEPIDYRQFLLTRADVTVADDGRSAMLVRGGQRLWLQLITPEGTIAVGDAGPLPWVSDPGSQRDPVGLRSIMIHLPDVTDATVAVRLVPLDAGQQPEATAPALTRLADWAVTADDREWLTGIKLDGKSLTDFAGGRFRYDVTVDAARTTIPKVGVSTPARVSARVTKAPGVPGVVRIETRRGAEAGPTYEVHLHRDGTTGLALPVAGVTASSDDGNSAALAVDGSLSTRWSAEGDGQTLTLDLGHRTDVAAAALAFYNGFARTSTFDVLTSRDGETWDAGLDRIVTTGTTDDLESYDLRDRSARYVRIVGHGNSASAFNSVLEVRVYGTDAAAAADSLATTPRIGEVSLSPSPVPELVVGESRPLEAAAVLTDGTAVDLSTAAVDWVSANPGVVAVDGDGIVTGVGGGTATVGAIVRSGATWGAVRATIVVRDPGHIEPSQDAHVRNGAFSDTAYGRGNLEVRNNPTNGSGFERISFLTFALDAAAGHEVASAKIHLFGRVSTESATTPVGVHAIPSPAWDEAALTWNTMPPLGDRISTFPVSGGASAWYEVDVTAAVQAAIAAGEPLGVALTGAVAAYGPHVQFTSREAGADAPYLEVVTAP